MPQKKGDPVKIDADEEPFAAPLEKMPTLKPAFQKDGTVTAANSSKINDGAAALVVASEEKAKAKGWKPIARIVALAPASPRRRSGSRPRRSARSRSSSAKTGLTVADIDLFEINEAFAAVAMAAIRELSLDPADASTSAAARSRSGHPIGASGARILTTLIHALRKRRQEARHRGDLHRRGRGHGDARRSGLSLPAFDLVVGGVPRFAAEAPWAWRLVARYLRELPARRAAPRRRAARPTVADAAGDAPIVLVQADPEAYLLPEPARRLVDGLASRGDLSALLPVSNEAESEEARFAPPFAYLTPTLLAEAVAFVAASGGAVRIASAPASPVCAVRRSALAALPADLPLRDVPRELGARGLAVGIDPGAYVHRYGAMDASAREDLAAKVPAGAAAVLDVGCSRGATAAALRARGVRRIVGIEPDREDAAAAASVYDEVLLRSARRSPRGFRRPLRRGPLRRRARAPRGPLRGARARAAVAVGDAESSSPPCRTLGHWSVVDDLIRGRFDYVPYSLLSGTHVRFFTRSTLIDLFEASGYRVRAIDADSWSRPRPAARRAGIASPPFRGRARTWTSPNFSPSPKRRADRAGPSRRPLGYHRRR